MRKPFAALFLFLLPLMAVAGQIRIVSDIPGATAGPTDTEVLQYDDGNPQWLKWGGTYRGVWFDPGDFYPENNGFSLEMMEWWFYQSPGTDPWDTSDFYAQIWTGDQNGPLVLLDCQLVTAYHGGPVYTYYDPPLWIEEQFWAICSTELSGGGWPSVLADGTPSGHSFLSDDFMVWECWNLGDYFIRAHGAYTLSFETTTWGSLKALF
jgi:hypothetical protein